MNHSGTLSLECPHCNTRTQFNNRDNQAACNKDNMKHQTFLCAHCNGLVLTKWNSYNKLEIYYPIVGDFKAQINLQKIENESVRKDYKEAIDCYNNGFYNASMVMARRAIHQEVEINKAKGDNLYQKIESLGISNNLKKLLNKVKNFGNTGAHPDFFLYGEDGEKLIPKENEKDFAKLSLIFLDKYFQDQYEMKDLIDKAPNSEMEMKKENE